MEHKVYIEEGIPTVLGQKSEQNSDGTVHGNTPKLVFYDYICIPRDPCKLYRHVVAFSTCMKNTLAYRYETEEPTTSNYNLQHHPPPPFMSRAILHVPLRRACRSICLSFPLNARARSWGKFAQKPAADLKHLSPRLKAAIQQKNEEKLAFQYIEPPVDVYPESPQTAEAQLKELAHLQPSRADLEKWRDSAIRAGRHAEAWAIEKLLIYPVRNYLLVDPTAKSSDLDWQFRDLLAISPSQLQAGCKGYPPTI